MTAYYNEIEPYAAQWLRNLIKAGHIAPGDVDERSIEFVRPDDLVGYTQCHFFAGIGIWSHALRLAGWPDDRPVWSGSCPCQPFSAAGKGEGIDDSRHLWPQFFRLIRECRPVAVIGEQVASADGLAWLDHVCVDLEEAGYAIGAIDTCAAGVGAPHIRQRLYWVADAQRSTGRKRRGDMGEVGCKTGEKIAERHTPTRSAAHSGAASAVDNPASARCDRTLGASRMPLPGERRKAGGVADADGERREGQRLLLRQSAAGRDAAPVAQASGGSDAGAVADDIGNGLERRTQQTVLGTGRRGQGNEARRGSASLGGWGVDTAESGQQSDEAGYRNTASNDAGASGGTFRMADSAAGGRSLVLDAGSGAAEDRGRQGNREPCGGDSGPRPTNGYWADADWIACRDGKARPAIPAAVLLAHGHSADMGVLCAAEDFAGSRTGMLRAFGNAIVGPQAAEFVRAFMEVRP